MPVYVLTMKDIYTDAPPIIIGVYTTRTAAGQAIYVQRETIRPMLALDEYEVHEFELEY